MKQFTNWRSRYVKGCVEGFLCSIVMLLSTHLYAQNNVALPVAPATWNANPFRQEVFIENKGQFNGNDNLPGSSILYGVDNGYGVYFSKEGMTWVFDNIEPMTPKEKREFEKREGESEEPEAERERMMMANHPVYIHMEWVGANRDVQIVAEEAVDNYFNYADPQNISATIQHCTGYKKITYKDLYPGIDVEYIFKNENGKEGIKYSVIIHPGADPSLVKMKYDGARVSINALGELNFHNEKLATDLLETGLHTFYLHSGLPVTSRFIVEKNTVRFDLGNYIGTNTIVIDPFLAVPASLTVDLRAYDVEHDGSGNVMVAGGFNNYKVAKYNSAGVLQWTFATVFDALFSWGDLAVDPAGNSYGMSGFPGGNIFKLSPAGVQLWQNSNVPFEHFNWDFNCNFSQLVLSSRGAGLGELSNVNVATGAITGTTMVSNSEIRSLCVAPSGTIYALTCLTVTSNVGNFLIARTPAFAVTAFNSIGSGYAWLENGVTYGNGQTILGPGWQGQNGIAADNCYIYTTNGALIEKRSRATGAVIATAPVPGGIPENNSGVCVDSCGNVYVGSQAGVYKFDYNLLPLSFSPTGNPVYCVNMNTGGEIIACGQSFVTSVNMTACNPLSCSANPTISFTTINPGCNANNGSATVTVSGSPGPYTYAWSNGGNTATVTNLAPGVYTCTVTAACNTLTGSVTITPPSLPAATISNLTNVSCAGGNNGSATVNPNGGNAPYTFAWTPSGGNNATANNLTAGNYTCTVTDASGCTTTATVAITQPTPITATSNVVNTSCGNSTGSATINPSGGNPGYTYAWNPTGQTTQMAINLAAGVYTCTVTDASGCTQNFQVTISNANGPVATLASQQDVSCNGGTNGSASVNVNGGSPPYTYAWTPSGGNNASAINLTVGNYACTVTDSAGCTQAVAVTVTEPPAFTVTHSSTQATCGGSNGSATVNVGGASPPYTYQWSSGGNGATENNLAAGTYGCLITDNNGCQVVDSVTVTQPSNITASSTFADVTCNGGSNGSATATPNGGTAPFTYAWSPSGGTNATASNLTAGNYSCLVTDNTGCSATTSVTITEPPAITMTLAHTDLSCFGSGDGSAWVSASGGTGSYIFNWSPLSGNNDTIVNKPAGSYTCTVTDVNGCAEIDSVNIQQPTQVAITAPDSILLCQGQSTTINATVSGGNPGYTITYSPSGPTVSPTSTTMYTIDATDTNGCAAWTDTVIVIVNPPLALNVSSPPAICNGGVVGLSAIGSGGDGNYTYTWSAGTTPSTGSNVNANPNSTTTYTVVITDGCGSSPDSATLTVTVYPTPQPVFTLSDSSGCAPFCVTFTNTTSNSVSCLWQFGDGGIDTVNCTATYCYTQPGVYDISLMITDNNGCTGSAGATGIINVYASPIAGFDFGPDDATMLNPLISFTDQSQGATSWSWDFGNSPVATSTQQNPTFAYPDSGSYTVTQICYNAYGCSDTTELTVEIEEDASLYIPNAFTPNGDGMNDYFYPQGVGVDEGVYEFWIFDRWGNLIFHSTTWGEGWDGKVQGGTGEIAQEDVYVWKLQYRSVTKKQTREYMGHVSLVK
jgi:gliding motility-associated-like protein